MKCEKISMYLPDYIENYLGRVKKFQISWHLKKCAQCQELANSFKNTLEILRKDVLEEPPVEIWQDMKENVMDAVRTMSSSLDVSGNVCAVPRKRLTWRRVLVAAAMLFVVSISILILFPSHENQTDSLHWSFFNSDLWDFSRLFQRMNQKTWVELSPKIEERFKLRLKKELQLNVQDESRLFPVLQTFSTQMKEYWNKYASTLTQLNVAIEKDETKNLENLLQDVHTIRKDWTDSRWHLLRDVKFILDKKQFARFLLFTERIPQELEEICNEVSSKNGSF